MSITPWSEHYAATRRRICSLVIDRDTATTVPGTPGWTAHDVVSHLTGIAADSLANHFEGAPGAQWTAAQVAARKARSTHDVVSEWTGLAPEFEGRFAELGGFSANFTIDAHIHEDDLREAYDLPTGQAPTSTFVLKTLARHTCGRRLTEAGLPALRILTEEGDDVVGGEGGSGLTLRSSRGEALRLLAGRRTRTQARALHWSGDPSSHLDCVPLFGWMPE